ncbi:MAG TPA: hypothetical protein V6C98_10030 [Thermosynechococcaceae cyanobacterium]
MSETGSDRVFLKSALQRGFDWAVRQYIAIAPRSENWRGHVENLTKLDIERSDRDDGTQ